MEMLTPEESPPLRYSCGSERLAGFGGDTEAHGEERLAPHHTGRRQGQKRTQGSSVSSAGRAGRGVIAADLRAGPPGPLEGLTLAWGLAPGSLLRASRSCSGLAGGAGCCVWAQASVVVRHWRMDRQGLRCKDGCSA